MEQDEHTPTPGTAVTRAEIDAARIVNMVASTITSLTWGRDMPEVVRRAFAEYCRRYDIDPVTEMNNLGGTPYVNADWFKRKLGELRMARVITAVRLEHIHADPRLDALRQDASVPEEIRAEASRRWFDAVFKRIQHNAPETAAAICLCTIVLADGSTITGCKWAGNGTSVKQPRHGGGSAPNPITENNATASVESGAIRRAAIQLFSHLSGHRADAINDRAPVIVDPVTMRTDYKRLAGGEIAGPVKGLLSPESVDRINATYAASDAATEPGGKMVTAPADGAYGLT